MQFFHMNCRVVGKAKGKSSVATAAYVSAEKLQNERTGLTHDFSRKKDVIFTDTVLCKNAPVEFRNHAKLWNAVEKIEKAPDARFARQFDLAIPNVFTPAQAKALFYDVARIFTEQGMCFDGGIHWEPGNHHFDFMVTTRPFREDGSWGDKERKEYVFQTDSEGRKIIDREDPNWWEDKKNPERCGIRVPEVDENGEQKLDKKGGKLWKRERVDATGWDRKEMVEFWRASCCEAINRRAQEYGYDIHLDHRSFKRQGIEKTPEIHEGYMARKMEQDGLVADRCQINRDIRKYNSVLDRIRQIAKEITTTIVEKARDILGRFKNLAGGFGSDRESGRNDESVGKSADRDRGSVTAAPAGRGRESQIEGRTGRTADLKRDIERTEQTIDKTERRIGELKGLIRQKKEERHERMERLKSRRAAVAHGGDPGGERGASGRKEKSPGGELSAAAADIRAFLGNLDAEDSDGRNAAEASIREARDGIRDSRAERGNIQSAERQSIAAAEQRRSAEQRWHPHTRRSERGPELQ